MINRLDKKKKVIQFVSEQLGCQSDAMDENTELYHDLQLWGDDVDPFFLNFCREFDFPPGQIDLSGCFPCEGWHLFFRPKRRIRIKHLINAAFLKKWPEIENA